MSKTHDTALAARALKPGPDRRESSNEGIDKLC